MASAGRPLVPLPACAMSRYVVAASLPLRHCSLSPGPLQFPLPVGHANQGVAQQPQISSLQGGTRWCLAHKEVRRTINLNCPRAHAVLLTYRCVADGDAEVPTNVKNMFLSKTARR